MLENTLKAEEGIVDMKVQAKQAKRLAEDIEKAVQAGRSPNILVQNLTRATQRSLQFIRWLRTGLTLNTSWEQAVVQLRPLMLRYLS
jgi:spore cortex formation protein SpoVR/YcgB (stage V sporulation)